MTLQGMSYNGKFTGIGINLTKECDDFFFLLVFKINAWTSRQAMVGGTVSLKCADIGD